MWVLKIKSPHLFCTFTPLTNLSSKLYTGLSTLLAKAKLFAIQCNINQAIANYNIKNIIVISDFLHIARRIFNSFTYSYQIYSTAISMELREFFSKDSQNYIKFWDCSSKQHWTLYQLVNKETKNMVSIPLFSYKQSWDFCKKSECKSIISQWKMIFQVFNSRGRNFLDLLSDNFISIEPSCSKGSPWLLQFGHLNSLCTWASRAITNHSPIGEYWPRFFPMENFACLCGLYPIKTRWHILHECKRFNNYWNLRGDTLGHFSLFL